MNRGPCLRRFELALAIALAVLAAISPSRSGSATAARRTASARVSRSRDVAAGDGAAPRPRDQGPLTAARLELDASPISPRRFASRELALAQESVAEELGAAGRASRSISLLRRPRATGLLRESLGQPDARRVLARRSATRGRRCGSKRTRGRRASSAWTVTCCARVAREPLLEQRSRGDGDGRVTFFDRPRGNAVTLDVRDNGAGVPESLRSRVFDPYITTRKIGEGWASASPSRAKSCSTTGATSTRRVRNAGTIFRLTFGGRLLLALLVPGSGLPRGSPAGGIIVRFEGIRQRERSSCGHDQWQMPASNSN